MANVSPSSRPRKVFQTEAFLLLKPSAKVQPARNYTIRPVAELPSVKQEEQEALDDVVDLISECAAESSDHATSNSDSSSGSSSDLDDEKLANVRPSAGPIAPAQFAGVKWYIHKRLGTLHKNSTEDNVRLACGRFKQSGFEPLRAEPKFEAKRCLQCFGHTLK